MAGKSGKCCHALSGKDMTDDPDRIFKTGKDADHDRKAKQHISARRPAAHNPEQANCKQRKGRPQPCLPRADPVAMHSSQHSAMSAIARIILRFGIIQRIKDRNDAPEHPPRFIDLFQPAQKLLRSLYITTVKRIGSRQQNLPILIPVDGRMQQ